MLAVETSQIYALFKVGTGEDHGAAAKPGMFDLKVGLSLSSLHLSFSR